MPRSMTEIVTHLRAVCGNPSISTTLIQTEDVLALCDAVDPAPTGALPPLVEEALQPHPNWKTQSFEYYAAHFLVGAGLTGGNIDGHVRGLAAEMKKQYDIGVEHGMKQPEIAAQ